LVSATPFTLRLYAFAGTALAPLAAGYLARRRARGKEHQTRFRERFGEASLPRPAGFLVWLHAASVGETMSILPLIEALASRGLAVLLTTGTTTSADLAANRLPAGAMHQFVPIDLPGAVRAFVSHWKPDLALFCESEIWPNLLREAHRLAIPVGIVNGRMSERSGRIWRRMRGTARSLLAPIALVLAQSEGDAARYASLGARAIRVGNLKFDVPPLPVDPAARARLATAIGPRPVLAAASTHPGEEAIVIAAFERIRAEKPDSLLILAPRHPARGGEIAALARTRGLETAIRSQGETPSAASAIYLADTLGELGLVYSLATLAFLGGSLVPIGGHNPIEPAKLGAPVLHGPHVANFRDVFGALDRAGAALAVRDGAELAEAFLRLADDPAARERLADAARAHVGLSEGALARTLDALAPYLPRGSR
jgi:3-deoxy-D-manno-octulosonic-acid transferase